jgi:hypothetical protein
VRIHLCPCEAQPIQAVSHDGIAPAVGDLLPQRPGSYVQDGGGAAKIPSAPNDEYAEAVDFGQVHFVEPAPFAGCALEPLELQESPDSESALTFCEKRELETMLRVVPNLSKAEFRRQPQKYASFVLGKPRGGGSPPAGLD